ncbi:MAG: [FeFe] hydrogenase H-cluster radical SAM maturase HydE [Clostridia bacterium]|nr:[FeFe] hydrogenase H-cluster radical SAM maturase HydE [Clostridia bacterium]
MTRDEISFFLNGGNDEKLFKNADKVRQEIFGKDVYIRGLIEISSICKNDCYYCGIRCSNKNAERYRLSHNEIFESVKKGAKMGFKTFVLQGGEDLYFTDDILCDIIYGIKNIAPDSAVTLSLGERSFESYKALKNAGADRYLLRHETATEEHYNMLHPENMLLKTRKKCLYDLKELGYQVGAGFMVGSPYQTREHILADFEFLKELNPEMIGVGPFIPHKDTQFKGEMAGDLQLTLRILSLLRLIFPEVLLPATTALATLSEDGRERALKSGANVVMPNLTPEKRRESYNLYDNKAAFGAESAEGLESLRKIIEDAGYKMSMSRGDSPKVTKERNG